MDNSLLINTLENIQENIRENNKTSVDILQVVAELDMKFESRFQRIEKDVLRIKTVWSTVVGIGAFLIGLFAGK